MSIIEKMVVIALYSFIFVPVFALVYFLSMKLLPEPQTENKEKLVCDLLMVIWAFAIGLLCGILSCNT